MSPSITFRLRGAVSDEHGDGQLLEDAADIIDDLESALRDIAKHQAMAAGNMAKYSAIHAIAERALIKAGLLD